MKRSVPIGLARDQFARLVHEAERGTPIEWTRRGQPVAVMVSVAEYRRLSGASHGFTRALQSLRAGLSPQELSELSSALEPVRDRDIGRAVGL